MHVRTEQRATGRIFFAACPQVNAMANGIDVQESDGRVEITVSVGAKRATLTVTPAYALALAEELVLAAHGDRPRNPIRDLVEAHQSSRLDQFLEQLKQVLKDKRGA